MGTRIQISRKAIYWRLQPKPQRRTVALIFGCQRSGTTLLGRVFENDLRTTVLHEDSPITGRDGYRLRLKPVDEVNRILDRYREPLVIVKPLVESQHAASLLEAISDSRGIWMFRGYRDVISSSLKRFHGQVSHLKAIINPDAGNWRSERVSNQVRALVRDHYAEDMQRENAAALVWYARNSLYFEDGLDNRDDMTLCRYEAIVTDPHSELSHLYRFLGYELPETPLSSAVDNRSVGLGADIPLCSRVEEACARLEQRLVESHERRARSHAMADNSLVENLSSATSNA